MSDQRLEDDAKRIGGPNTYVIPSWAIALHFARLAEKKKETK